MIVEGELPVAVAFSNSADGSYYFRSSLESLSMAFDAVCNKTKSRLSRSDRGVTVKIFDGLPDTNAWMNHILHKICDNSIWSIGDVGKIDNDESSVNLIVSKYIGWANSSAGESRIPKV